MHEQHLQSLELLLQIIAQKNTNVFPNPSQNYFDRYTCIVEHLKKNVYSNINTGLSANSSEQGLYTDHGPEHFDMVVLYAGQMLGLSPSSSLDNIAELSIKNNWLLQPYEIYLLLLSIRLHDVGNIFGREQHEKNIGRVIRQYEIPFLMRDTVEARKVAQAGGAHGGIAPNGSKDTIDLLSENESDGHIKNVNLKKIAAIVRFADEICENRHRSPAYFECFTPEHNVIFHLYAKSITSSYVENQILHLQFELNRELLLEEYPLSSLKDSKKATLPNVFIDRIQKTELERRYCSRYLPDGISIKEIFVCVKIVKYDEYHYVEVLDKKEFTLKERDYPGNINDILTAEIKTFLSNESIQRLIEERENG